MVQRLVIVLLVMIVSVGLVRAGDAKEVIIGNAKELKGIKAKKINPDIAQHSNSIHKPLTEDPFKGEMPAAYILDLGKQRFIKDIAIYCHRPIKDIAIYIRSSKSGRFTEPLNLGWTFLKYIESPIKSGDTIEIQVVASSIQLIQEIKEDESQPESKDGIQHIEAFGEYGNKLQTELSILRTLMLPDRWAPNGNHPRSQPPKPYWSRSLLTIDVWIAAQGQKQPKKQESWDSKDQGHFRKGSTPRIERGLVLVSFPVRLLKSDDCGNKTEEVQRGHEGLVEPV